jgi:hypothetical protein
MISPSESENPMTTTCTVAALEESLRGLAVELVEAGCTVHVAIPEWTEQWNNREVSYFYVTKDDLPGIVVVNGGQFPRLGERPTFTIPVAPNREWGSAVLHDGRPDESERDAVLRGLELDTVMPRFVKNPPLRPVPVSRRGIERSALIPIYTLTLED